MLLHFLDVAYPAELPLQNVSHSCKWKHKVLRSTKCLAHLSLSDRRDEPRPSQFSWQFYHLVNLLIFCSSIKRNDLLPKWCIHSDSKLLSLVLLSCKEIETTKWDRGMNFRWMGYHVWIIFNTTSKLFVMHYHATTDETKYSDDQNYH